jgi:hypothetical protein
MSEEDSWNTIIHSIKRAARILNINLTETDMPDYENWLAARTIHNYLWNQVYLKRKKKDEHPR